MVWRHWLHRDYLTLEDGQGVRREVESELPEDLRISLQRLQSNGEGCGGLAITLSAQVARCSRRRFAGTTPDGDPGITAVYCRCSMCHSDGLHCPASRLRFPCDAACPAAFGPSLAMAEPEAPPF